MLGFIEITWADVDLQQMFFARRGFYALFAAHQLTCNQSKEVARLFVWVQPSSEVAAFF